MSQASVYTIKHQLGGVLMKSIPILILGATMEGIAIAVSAPNKTLIVERSMMLGSDFITSMNIKPCRMQGLKSKKAVEFRDDLIRRNLLNDKGQYHAPRISSALANLISINNVNIMLLTEVVSIKEHSGGFEVLLFNADGINSIFVEQIIDTTSTGIFDYHISIPIIRSLCAMLYIPDEECIEYFHDNEAEVLKGKFKSEHVLKVYTSLEDDWIKSRARLHNYWKKNRYKLSTNCFITSIASFYSYDFIKKDKDYIDVKIQDNWRWIPSASYDDMIQAYEGGSLCFSAL